MSVVWIHIFYCDLFLVTQLFFLLFVAVWTTFSVFSSFFMHGWHFRKCCGGIMVKCVCVGVWEYMCEYVGVWEMHITASRLTYSDGRDRACSSIAAKAENSPRTENINWTALSAAHSPDFPHYFNQTTNPVLRFIIQTPFCDLIPKIVLAYAVISSHLFRYIFYTVLLWISQ